MSSEQTAVVEAMETSAPSAPEAQNNGHDSEPAVDCSPSPKKTKLDESADDSQGKRRSSGRPKKNRDEEMLAEAKKLCGELDTSGGRSMRKRPDPPKSVEKKREPVARRASKKSLDKGDDKNKDKEVAENGTAEEEKADKADDTKQDDEKKEETKNEVAADNTTSSMPALETNDKPDEKVAVEAATAPASTEENKSAAQTTEGLAKEAENGEASGAQVTTA